jgi:hypothetical protein
LLQLDLVKQLKSQQERVFNLPFVGQQAILGVVLTSIPAQSLPEP